MEVETEPDDFAFDANRIERALHRAVRNALIMHKKLGNPIVVWQDGKVVTVPAEEIVIPEERD